MVDAGTASSRVPMSLRLPHRVVDRVDEYACANRTSKTDAFLYFLEKGIAAEDLGGQAGRFDEIRLELAEIKRLLTHDDANGGGTRAAVCDAVARSAADFPAIERAYLFGSFARGDFNDRSDIDVRLELHQESHFNLRDLAQFQKSIEKATGRNVDVVSARTIKNESLAAAIEKDKVLVYEREKR